MGLIFGAGIWENRNFAPLLTQLESLYSVMDRQYEEAIQYYGFSCDGCRENCCRTRFYHHTIIEYFYLMRGVVQLPLETQNVVFDRADIVIHQTRIAQTHGRSVRLFCPLNQEALCLVYPFRPMICRLHGIAHELHPKGLAGHRGEGCARFDDLARGKPYFPYDRTHFYTRMAQLETDLRKKSDFKGKFKMTIAEMLRADIPIRFKAGQE